MCSFSPGTATRSTESAGDPKFSSKAMALLAERKRLAANAPIPCRRVADEHAIDTSLAENEDRKALHPADAYEAFAALHDDGKGLGAEEIAARFGVSAHTVRQRLRLGTVSPAVLAAYRDDKLTLDHVMAFTVTEDHAAQERAYTELQDWQRTPAAIRRVLTQASVPAHDPRVLLVGLDAYQAAGGHLVRRAPGGSGSGRGGSAASSGRNRTAAARRETLGAMLSVNAHAFAALRAVGHGDAVDAVERLVAAADGRLANARQVAPADA